MNYLGKISRAKLLRVFNRNSISDAIKHYINVDKPSYTKRAEEIA